jgi:hypothetical protein
MISSLKNIFYYLYYIIYKKYETRTIERINSNDTFVIYLSDDDFE